MMILKFSVYTCSVLEGMGSYIYRYKKRDYKSPNWRSKIRSPQYRDAIKKAAYPNECDERKILSKKIQEIINLRDEVHLDRVSEKIKYHLFEYEAFIKTHQTLRSILMSLNKDKIIDGSPLFDLLDTDN